ncbi:MAG TPA: hypothetical protein VJK01_00665 [Candidatus Paceibacterota bacterium]
MKYVAVCSVWLGISGALTAMAYYGMLNNGIDAVMAIVFGGIMAVLGTLAITH